MKILVIGSKGFIGQHALLVEEDNKNNEKEKYRYPHSGNNNY